MTTIRACQPNLGNKTPQFAPSQRVPAFLPVAEAIIKTQTPQPSPVRSTFKDEAANLPSVTDLLKLAPQKPEAGPSVATPVPAASPAPTTSSQIFDQTRTITPNSTGAGDPWSVNDSAFTQIKLLAAQPRAQVTDPFGPSSTLEQNRINQADFYRRLDAGVQEKLTAAEFQQLWRDNVWANMAKGGAARRPWGDEIVVGVPTVTPPPPTIAPAPAAVRSAWSVDSGRFEELRAEAARPANYSGDPFGPASNDERIRLDQVAFMRTLSTEVQATIQPTAFETLWRNSVWTNMAKGGAARSPW